MRSLTAATEASVAVIIAAFRAQDSIARAIASVLSEPEVTEVWVIDDCSPDATAEQALAADDGTGRLRLVRQAENGGPAAARNRALAESRADWLCVLDADDYMLPGRIGRLLARSGKYDLVADELLRVASPTDQPDHGDLDDTPPALEVDLATFVAGNVSRKGEYRQELGFIKPLMRGALLRELGLRYDTRLRLGEDYVFYAEALARGARLCVSQPLGYVAVVRPDSLSGRHGIEDLEALRDSDTVLERLRPMTHSEKQALRAHRLSLDKRVQWRRLIEAVKSRNVAMALSTLTSPAVTLSLLGELTGQVLARSGLTRRPHG